MKNLNYLKLLCLTGFISIGLNSIAQAPYWKLNGNPNFGPDAVNNTNNTIGTNDNFALNFATNGIQRMLINNGGTGNAAGRVAMGNNLPPLFIPQARLHLYQDAPSAIYTKYTAGNTGTNLTDGFDVGYNATSAIQNRQYAEMHNRENTAIKFFI